MLTPKGIALVLTTILSVVAVVCNALWGPRARARRRLARGKKTIADREIVTLTGTVRNAGQTLEAPLSGKSCVLYEVFGHVKKQDTGAKLLQMVKQLGEHKMVPFELDIGGEVVLVDGSYAEVELKPLSLIPRKLEREVAFFDKHEQPRELFPTSSFEETTVKPGDRIAVQGMAIVESDPTATDERGYRDNAPRKVRIVAHEEHPLTIGRAR